LREAVTGDRFAAWDHEMGWNNGMSGWEGAEAGADARGADCARQRGRFT
jgi:hypothetical protein